MGAIISQNIQYSGATLSQQSTPIGAIIPYMGTTAPSGYLACDGGVYSISLYPLLAGFFETQFGSINYFGGDGTTTFAVPNLQGEFIRGAGTNSHSNQGSGGSVGEHQDGTRHTSVYGWNGNQLGINVANINAGSNAKTSLEDFRISRNGIVYANATGAVSSSSADPSSYTSRPTNTSVLYIIKAKSDRLDKITFAEVDDASEADDVVWSAEKTREAIGPESYSTSEQWTGKYWIDGKKIYSIVTNTTNAGTTLSSDVWTEAATAPNNIAAILCYSLIHSTSPSPTASVAYNLTCDCTLGVNSNNKFVLYSRFSLKIPSQIVVKYTKTTT